MPKKVTSTTATDLQSKKIESSNKTTRCVNNNDPVNQSTVS